MFGDLHTHSTCSDGTVTPAGIVDEAVARQFYCVAITDHDTVEGIAEAQIAGQKAGVEIIPGVEVSTSLGEKNVHILGYYMDITHKGFLAMIEGNRDTRIGRMGRMVTKLNAIGYPVDYDELIESIGEGTVGRALLARFLVEKGYFTSLDEVFYSILGDGKAVYEPVRRISPVEAIKVIRDAGGVTSLAHPGYTSIDNQIPALAAAGLDAIEAESSQHPPPVQKRYRKIADKNRLLITGGSDYHGPQMPGRAMGSIRFSYERILMLQERAAGREPVVAGI
jgi:hypothetical protein